MQIQRLVFPEAGRCEVEEVALDEKLNPGEVLIKNTRSLISAGTELSLFTRTHRGIDVPEHKWAKYPFPCGYTSVGEVVQGALPVGTHVYHSGGHATYSKAKLEDVVPVPAGLSDELAVFFGLSNVGMTAIRLAPVVAGGQVVVIGAGIVGVLCAQLYQLTGAGVVAVTDLSEKRLERARLCGITTLFNAQKKPLAEWVKDLGSRGAEWVIEAVGNAQTITAALKAVAPRGNVVLLGSPRAKQEIDPYYDIHCKGIHVIGAHSNIVEQKIRMQDRPLLMGWLATQKLKVEPLITHWLPMTDGLQGYIGLRDNPDDFMGVMLRY